MKSSVWGFTKTSWAIRMLKPQQFQRTQISLFFFHPSKRPPSQEKWDWVFQLPNYLLEDFLLMEGGFDSTLLGRLPGTEFYTSLSDPLRGEKKDHSFLSPHPDFSFCLPVFNIFACYFEFLLWGSYWERFHNQLCNPVYVACKRDPFS